MLELLYGNNYAFKMLAIEYNSDWYWRCILLFFARYFKTQS